MTSLDRPTAPDPYDLLPQVGRFTVTSLDVVQGQPLDVRHVADGDNESPQLSWSGFPDETQSFAITCFDPDAPTPSGWWHWAAFNVPVTVTSVARNAGANDGSGFPAEVVQLLHDGGARGYGGAAPPPGDRAHRYIFAVHALRVPRLDLTEDSSCAMGAFFLAFETIARATITPVYQRPFVS